MYNFRTDLALERKDIYQKANKLNEIDGVESTEEIINELIKISKDTASSAVFIACIISIIVGIAIFVPKIIEVLK